MSKIGILGGTFDPIHNGHIELAVQVKKELKLTEVLIIPAAQPPHKSGECSSFADRFEMARLAFEGMDGFAVSDIEKKLGGRSFTINTIRALRDIYPAKTEFYLLIGGDQLFTDYFTTASNYSNGEAALSIFDANSESSGKSISIVEKSFAAETYQIERSTQIAIGITFAVIIPIAIIVIGILVWLRRRRL